MKPASGVQNFRRITLLSQKNEHETVLILDFGSQYTQLIARRVREAGVYCEIHPFNVSAETILARKPRGLILSGSPASVYNEDAPRPDPRLSGQFRVPCSGHLLRLTGGRGGFRRRSPAFAQQRVWIRAAENIGF